MATDLEDVERRTRPPRSRRKATRRDVICTILALLTAVFVAIVLRAVLGVDSSVVVGLGTYATFVCALVAAEVAAQRHEASEVVVDLPAVERAETANSSTATSVRDLFEDLDEPPSPAPVVVEPAPIIDDGPPSEDRPNRRAALTSRDLAEVLIAVLAAAAFAGVVRVVWGLQGPTGTFIWWFIGFVSVFYALVRGRAGSEAALDRIVSVLIWSVGVLVVGVLTWMLVYLFGKGLPGLSTTFLTEDLSKVGPLTPGGGAYHAILGTLEQIALATIAVVPLAILTAVYLHEIQGRLARPVRFIVDAMSGLPSIVAGLLVFTVWVDGRGFSGVAGSAALIVLMLPTVTRASEEILRTVPDLLREASLALGAPQWRVTARVVLPTARAGLVTAAILGVARGIGETAPMLLTAFGSDSTNTNPFKDPQSDLPLFVWKLIRLPNQTQIDRGWTGLLVLVLLVLILFVSARFISNRSQRKLGRAR